MTGDQAEGLRRALLSSRARTVAVTSGKGGVGKSNVAVNVALSLQRLGKSTLLVDADLGMANVDVLLGLGPHPTLDDLRLRRLPAEKVVVRTEEGLRVLAGAAGAASLAGLSEEEVDALMQAVSEAGRDVEFVLLDTGAGISREVVACVGASDQVLLVTTPEPTSLMDAYAVLKRMHALSVQRPVGLVVNRCRSAAEGDEVAARLQDAARRFLGLGVTFLGGIPEDAAVAEAVRRQVPLVRAWPRSSAALALARVAARLAGQGAARGTGLAGWVRSLQRWVKGEGWG